LNELCNISRKIAIAILCLGLMVGIEGCKHKTQLAPLPPVMTPIALVDIPEPDDLPMIEPTAVKLPPVPVATNAKPKREKKKPALKVTPTPEPVQVASAAAPPAEETVIGALTAGGDANPQTKQEAADLIASIEKRIGGLSAQKAEEQKTQVSKVKNFLKDAEDALKSGDVEGAKTLATKARLLLDELEK
jgi:ribosomal protein S20